VRRQDTLAKAARAGLLPPLGRGGIDIAGTVAAPERGGYDGLYLSEQDLVTPDGEEGAARPQDDVAASIALLRLLSAHEHTRSDPDAPDRAQRTTCRRPAVLGPRPDTRRGGEPAPPDDERRRHGEPAPPDNVRRRLGGQPAPDNERRRYGEPAPPDNERRRYGEPAPPDNERRRRGRPGERRCPLMRHVRMTTAQAIVAWLTAQRSIVDGSEVPLFPGVFAIFGHGNVVALGHALEQARERIPTWRGQNEQGMALAAVAYAKVMRRRQVMVATSSIGPGAMNMVTAAGVAMANRLPLLLLSGDTFQSRIPDPVLQQVEHPGSPSTTANDAFRAVVRYFDRIVRPEQVVASLPQALGVLLDPGECGPAFIAMPQDVQAEAFDCPSRFLEPVVHEISRPRPDRRQLERAAAALRGARRPLVIAGGGVHYSLAEPALSAFAARHGLPVVETVAGKSCLTADDPALVGPIGVTGADPPNSLARRCDVLLAVGTRLQDFSTGSWTIFGDDDLVIVTANAARFDAEKHRSLPVVGDALVCLEELSALLGGWRAPDGWLAEARAAADETRLHVAKSTTPAAAGSGPLPSYAEVIGAVHALATPEDYVLTAAGGLPGELNVNWLAKGVGTVDIEYGFSCMGYEISGGWGAAMARRHGAILPSPAGTEAGGRGDGTGNAPAGEPSPPRGGAAGDVIVLVGDGSYLMANSDLYSSVLSGHKMIVVVCDNGGYAVIERLQRAQGGASYNNLFETSRVVTDERVDFAANAASLGCRAETVSSLDELAEALRRARRSDRTAVIAIRTDPARWTEGGAFWEVGVPEVSDRPEVRAARRRLLEGKAVQRIGW
jgi:3D-(3,5/4)-trihydroxycyclohexane-1,2-dione acylhydrolase (decyclizing)